jgi:hypothetical protein
MTQKLMAQAQMGGRTSCSGQQQLHKMITTQAAA